MASGNTLLIFPAIANLPVSANGCELAARNGSPVLNFDTTTQETAVFIGVIPQHYAGGGITVYATWAAATATSGTIGWDVAFERINASRDMDADNFAAAQTIVAATTSGTSGIPTVTNVAIANGSAIDSVVAGDLFRLRVRRDVANDTATGDGQLISVELRET